MNTSERSTQRQYVREQKKLNKKLDKFTPSQQLVIANLVSEEASKLLGDIASMINTCYFNAMRENKIGEARANKILNRTEELIRIENDRYERYVK